MSDRKLYSSPSVSRRYVHSSTSFALSTTSVVSPRYSITSVTASPRRDCAESTGLSAFIGSYTFNKSPIGGQWSTYSQTPKPPTELTKRATERLGPVADMFAFDLLVQSHDTVNKLFRAWRAARHVHIHWHDFVHTLHDSVVIKHTAA